MDGRHIQMLLGHSDLKTTERYLNSDTRRFAEAMKRAIGSPRRKPAGRSQIGPTGSSRPTALTKNPNFISGPPGDRTRDTVIKSHVLYH